MRGWLTLAWTYQRCTWLAATLKTRVVLRDTLSHRSIWWLIGEEYRFRQSTLTTLLQHRQQTCVLRLIFSEFPTTRGCLTTESTVSKPSKSWFWKNRLLLLSVDRTCLFTSPHPAPTPPELYAATLQTGFLIIQFSSLDILKLNGSSKITGEKVGESMATRTSPAIHLKTAASENSSTPPEPSQRLALCSTAKPAWKMTHVTGASRGGGWDTTRPQECKLVSHACKQTAANVTITWERVRYVRMDLQWIQQQGNAWTAR